ncbi:MAG: hypothetical protein D6705_10350 [Deltaproteobacteria bacterium]|nr:MAG: hypothetical protein D6705_10350 [Deltaproteobacteria bacterium]
MPLSIGRHLGRKLVHPIFGFVLPALLCAFYMWRVWDFTVDDAYISYRYARNLARGLGLVYNPGERVEGYTNFLWTVLLAGGIRVGIDPNVLAKVLGAGAAILALAGCYRLDTLLAPVRRTPPLGAWFLATSAPFTGYAVFGLETAAFAACAVWGLVLAELERRGEVRWPASAVVFAVATLLRPEGPMLFGFSLLVFGRRMFGRAGFLRIAVFALPVLAHLAFRRAYYGLWVPFTFVAKTGDLAAQVAGGKVYLADYLEHAGPIWWACPVALAWFAWRRSSLGLAATGACLAWAGYVVAVGGDWMKFFRFFVPIEPIGFAACAHLLRRGLDGRRLLVRLLAGAYLAFALWGRPARLDGAHRVFMVDERLFWRNAAGQTADWLLRHERGTVGIGDLGYVGYATDYPILDLLGLVDPVIGRLPGGYTRKLGPGFTDRIFDVMPRYLVFILGNGCNKAYMAGSKRIYHDPRFAPNYALAHELPVGARVSWCIFERRDAPAAPSAPEPKRRADLRPVTTAGTG